MQYYQLLDSTPIFGVFAAFSIASLIMYEVGYRFGCWWQSQMPVATEGPTAMIVGSLLAIMGFLLAITMGMASDRFDKRRELVLAEANSIGTTYLRAGYMPEPASGEIRELLREYVPLRISQKSDPEEVKRRIARSLELHAQLWLIAEKLARSIDGTDVQALFIESLNETIDLHETRVTVGIYGRVPETVVFLLILGSLMTLSMVGYSAGLSLRRSSFSAVVLVALLGAVITLVIDLDRSQDGFLQVNQQPLLDLQEQIRSPWPVSPRQ